MTEARVTFAHLRTLHYCAAGARQWCARYGLSWEELKRPGLPCEAVEATGDAFGLAAVALARSEVANGQL